MKRFTFLLLIVLSSISFVFSQSHFTTIWSGNGTDHMNFYVSTATIDGVALDIDDEIAVFDGANCVGVSVVTGPGLVSIEASNDDPVTTGIVDGYIAGNTATFLIWDDSEGVEISDISVDLTGGTLIFTVGGSAFVNLAGSADSNPLVSNSDTAFMQYTTESITIDGVDDEGIWQNIAAIPITNLSGDPVDDAFDFAAEFKVCWSDEDLYLLFDITDETLINYHEIPWENDVVELYFDMNNSRNVFEEGGDAHAYDHDDSQTRITWASGEYSGNQNLGGLDIYHQATGDGYMLEIRIPRYNLCPAFGVGQWFGFDIAVVDNDDDGGLQNTLTWHYAAGDDAWRNPSVFGVGRLTDEVGQLPVEGTPLLTHNGYYLFNDYWIGHGRVLASPTILTDEFTVHNIGQLNLTDLDLTISGANYSGSALSTTSLSSGESTNFSVDFDPSTLGGFDGAVDLSSSDINSPFHFELYYEVDGNRRYYVSTTGSDDTGDGTELNPFRNINHAAHMAISGDTVVVLPGTYEENIHINNKELILTSEFMFTSSFSSIENTVLVGDGNEAVIGIYNAQNTEVVGFTITNGNNAIAIDNSTPLIRNNVLKGSHSTGLMAYGSSSPRILNNLIIYNNHHGIVFNSSNGEAINNTFYSNAHHLDEWESGAIACQNSDAVVKNNIMYNNNSFGVYVTDGTPDVSYNNVFGYNETPYENVSSTGGEMELRPLFYEIAHEDFRLQIVSPCIDAGDPDPMYNDPDGTRNDMGAYGGEYGITYTYEDGPPYIEYLNSIPQTGTPGTEVTFHAFIWDAVSSVASAEIEIENPDETPIATITLYDDGAHGDAAAGDSIFGNVWTSPAGIEDTYFVDIVASDDNAHETSFDNYLEFRTRIPGIIYVSTEGSDDTGDGSELNPYRNIQHTVHQAVNGDTILVLPGTYYEFVQINDKELVLTSEYILTSSFASIENTIIEDEADEAVVGIYNGGNTEIIGLTLNSGTHALAIDNSSPMIRNNILKESMWAGISISGGSSPRIHNNLIIHNSHDGISFSGSQGEVVNNTIYSNAHGLQGWESGAIACRDGSDPMIKNNIMMRNNSFGVYVTDGNPDVSYNDVYEFNEGAYDNVSSTGGEMELRPLFFNTAHEDFRLQIVSPCIDAGDPDPLFNDADGTRNDMGVFGGPYGISYSYGDGPPTIESLTIIPQAAAPGTEVIIHAFIWDAVTLVASAEIEIENPDENPIANITLYDDGAHSDGAPGDSIFGNVWTSPAGIEDTYFIDIVAADDNAQETSFDNIFEFRTRNPGSIYVSTSGSDDTGDGTELNPYRNINHAVGMAVDSDTIYVLPGTYDELVHIFNRNLVLTSEFITTSSFSSIENTRLNGYEGEPVIHLFECPNFEIIGFTIANGNEAISCNNSSPVIRNNIIRDSHNDGINIHENSSPQIYNNLIIYNGDEGVDFSNSDGELINNTFYQNASGAGGVTSAIDIGEQSNPIIKNNIMLKNGNYGVAVQDGGGAPTISYNNVFAYSIGAYNNTSSSGGELELHPLLYNTAHEDFRLQIGSPCIDTGDPDPLFNDLDGTRNDMGAFGGQYGITYTYEDGPPTIENFNTNPQAVIPGMEVTFQVFIWDAVSSVASAEIGIQNPDESPIANITLYDDGAHSDDAPGDSIFGNVWTTPAGIEDSYNIDIVASDDNAHETSIDNIHELHTRFAGIMYVSISGSDDTGDGSDLNPYRNINYALDRAVDGDTICVLPGTYYEPIQINDRDLVITSEFIFTSSFSSIENTILVGVEHDAVIHMRNRQNSEIIGLTLQNGATALSCDNSSPMIRNNILKESTWWGIYISDGSSPRIHNNVIIHNNHDAITFSGSQGEVVNNTFYSNAHGLGGGESGAIACRDGSDPMIKNNIMMRNNSFGVYVTDGNPDVSYNDVYEFNEAPYDNVSSTGGEMELHPLFNNSEHNDFKLQIGSPCIDAGDPDPSFNDPDGTRNDMGAYGGQYGISYTYEDGPPTIEYLNHSPHAASPGTEFIFHAFIWDAVTMVASAEIEIESPDENPIANITLYDDGAHSDGAPGDSIFGNVWTTPGSEDTYLIDIIASDDNANETSIDNIGEFRTRIPGIIYVSTEGSDDTGDGTELNPYRNINHAVGIAVDSDTILVLPGTYDELVHIHQRSLVLTSEFIATSSFSSVENTRLNGYEGEPVIHLFECPSFEIIGFTIANGNEAISCNNSSPVIRNNIIRNSHYDGINIHENSNPKIHNNLIIYNNQGGITFSQSNGEAINNTFYSNALGRQDWESSAITCWDNSDPVIKNNIMLRNNNFGISDTDGNPNVSFNDVYNFNEAPYNNVSSTGGEMELHPIFYNTASEDYKLQIGSPCIDAGDPDPMYNDPDGTRNDMGAFGGPYGLSYTYEDGPPTVEYININPHNALPGTEVVIQALIWDAVSIVTSVEIEIENPDESPIANITLYDDGAHNDGDSGDSIYGNVWTTPAGNEEVFYVDLTASDDNAHVLSHDNIIEFNTHIPGILYVSTEGSDDTGDGTELNPYRNINHAVGMAVDYDTILVLPGTYDELVHIFHRSLVLTSEYIATSSFSSVENTILNGYEGEPVIHFFECPNIEIIGFTIANGNEAISCNNSSPVIRNNIIRNSHSDGINIHENSSPKIHNNLIIHNNHGGITFSQSNGEAINNTFYSNALGRQDWESSAIACWNSDPVIKNNIMLHNNNFGIYQTDGNPDVSYNDVYDFNEAPYENVSSTGGEIELHPIFYNTASEDYKLQIGSPCIDAGDPDPMYNDLDGTRNDMGAFGGPYGISYTYEDGPPSIEYLNINPQNAIPGTDVTFQALIWDAVSLVASAEIEIENPDESPIANITLYDDGAHEDGAPGDSIFGNVWTTPAGIEDTYFVDILASDDNAHVTSQNNIIELNTRFPGIIYVSTEGSDDTGDGSLANPYRNIIHGMHQTVDGDTIIVFEGTYFENIWLWNRNIVLGSQFLTTGDPQYISQTIIDGNHNGTVIGIMGDTDFDLRITGFTIQNGEADWNAGMFVSGSPRLDNLIVENNYSHNNGGGIGFGTGEAVLSNIIIRNNGAGDTGGGIILWDNADPTIENTLITGNTVGNRGAGIYCGNQCDPVLTNVTISNNGAGSHAGAVLVENNSNMILTNSIIWGNTPNEIVLDTWNPASLTVSYSDLTGGESGIENEHGNEVFWLGGNIDQAPLFYNMAEEDYTLQIGSPCIDAGDPDPGHNDPDGTRNDMGAYGGPGGTSYTYGDGPPVVELIGTSPHVVPVGDADTIQVRVWDDLGTVSSVQAEIQEADETPITTLTLYDDGAHGDEATGDSIYGNVWPTPPGNVAGYWVDVAAVDDIANSATHNNILRIVATLPEIFYVDHSNSTGTEDGSMAFPFLTIQEAIDRSSRFDTIRVAQGIYYDPVNFYQRSFVVEGGYTNVGWERDIELYPTIIDGNNSHTPVTIGGASPIIDGFTIQNGWSDDQGGAGINGGDGDPIIQNCIIQNNQGTGNDEWGAGGICFNGGFIQIINCQIINNNSPGGAGGFRASQCQVRIDNTLFVNNTGNMAIHFDGVHGEMFNCTVADNERGIGFGGSDINVINCIQWNNNNDNWGDLGQISYTNWEGYIDGPGNMDADPLFVDPASGDFSLSDASPCINKGIYDASGLGLPEFDLAGNPREFGGRIEMGAYENQNVTLPPVDLEVIHWSDPGNRCDMDATEPVTIWVRNIGLDAQDDYILSYSNDGGNTFTSENVSIPIQPSDTLIYTFTQDGDFSAFGDFHCFASVSVAGDADTGNDTLNTMVFGRTDLAAGDYFTGFEWDDPNTERWTSEDLDEDGRNWRIMPWLPKSGENSYAVWGPEMDDWLYSHCFYLESSKTYGVSFQYKKYYDTPGINLELKAGNDPSFGSMTIDVLEIVDLENRDYKYAVAQLSVPATGVYYLGLHSTNVSGQWNYLFLDEVEVFEMDDYDLKLSGPTVITDYTLVPLKQAQAVSFRADVINKGAMAATGVTLDVDINGGLFNTSGTVASLAPGEEANILATDSYIPDEVGTYGIDFMATMNEPETNLLDNGGYQELIVSDSIYAKDGGNPSSGVVSNTGGINGNSFEILAADNLSSISVFFHRGNDGEQFHFSVFESWAMVDTTVGPMIFASDTFAFDQGMADTWNTFPMAPNGVDLSVGDYLIAIHTLNDNDIVLGSDDTRDGFTINYNEQNVPRLLSIGPLMLRANFGGSVECNPPADWTVNEANFANNGQVTAKVFLDDVAVESGFLAAFVGDECRSMPVEASYFEPGDHYVFDVFCYSNEASGEMLTFKYFDNTNCEILEPFTESVEFISDMIVGDAQFPFELHYPGEIPMDLQFVVGWNWFSVNLLADDMSLGNLISCTTNDDYIKNQTESATYFDGYGWFGSIVDVGGVDPLSLYKIKTINPCGVSYMGIPVDVLTESINIVPGWNWIGYLPNCTIPIAEALDSLNLETNDYIKNQTETSTYFEGYGWFGSLVELVPGEGYMLKKGSADILVYPECPPASAGARKAATERKAVTGSSLDPHQFEFNGSVTAQVYKEGSLVGSENDLVLAYVNGQLRGKVQGAYFDPADAYAFPLMVFSNVEQGEEVTFRYYHAENDQLYSCFETLVFQRDMIVADATDAFQLHVDAALGMGESGLINGLSLDVYPNPFKNQIHIDYSIAERSKVRLTVYDMLGKIVEYLDERTLDPGSYTMDWKADMQQDGTYLLKLTTDDASMIKRIILIK